MNPRRNLQTRKNRRKRNEGWLLAKRQLFVDQISNKWFMAARQCGKTHMTWEIFKHVHGIEEIINVDGSDSGWRTIGFTAIPEDEFDAMRRYHAE